MSVPRRKSKRPVMPPIAAPTPVRVAYPDIDPDELPAYRATVEALSFDPIGAHASEQYDAARRDLSQHMRRITPNPDQRPGSTR